MFLEELNKSSGDTLRWPLPVPFNKSFSRDFVGLDFDILFSFGVSECWVEGERVDSASFVDLVRRSFVRLRCLRWCRSTRRCLQRIDMVKNSKFSTENSVTRNLERERVRNWDEIWYHIMWIGEEIAIELLLNSKTWERERVPLESRQSRHALKTKKVKVSAFHSPSSLQKIFEKNARVQP